jgi:hypothetical protein
MKRAPLFLCVRRTVGVFFTLFALTLRGDTVELKTGERVDGAFRQASAAGVVIEVAGQTMTIPLEKVQAIYFGAAKPTSALKVPTASAEALDALRGLRSVTDSGVSFRDYAPRVLDAKVKVDRYFGSPTTDTEELRNAIGVAMREYELASRTWALSISASRGTEVIVQSGTGKTIEEDAGISKCPAVRNIIDQVDKERLEVSWLAPYRYQIVSWARLGASWSEQRQAMIGYAVGQTPRILWACASAQLGDADRLLAQPAAPPEKEAPKVVPTKAASIDPVPVPPRARIANQ